MKYNYEKLDNKEVLDIIKSNNICILGCSQKEKTYMCPLNYESDYRDYNLVIKIKSLDIGKKIRYIKNNNQVCLYFDICNQNIIKSIIAYGEAYIDRTKKDKKYLEINIIINKFSGRKYLLNNKIFN